MTIYYILADKWVSNLRSGNLESSNYGEFDANDRRFTGFISGLGVTFTLLNEKPEPNSVSEFKIVLKVQIDELDLKNSLIMKERVAGGLDISARMFDNPKEKLKVKVISQVMPDGTERYKHNAELEEKALLNQKNEKKDPIHIRAFTYLAQKVADSRNAKIGIDDTPKTGKRI